MTGRGAAGVVAAVVEAAAGRVTGARGSMVVAGIFSCMAAGTTRVPTDATGALLPVAATPSPEMVPSHAIKLASANPKTNEITREVVSIVWIVGCDMDHCAGPGT